MEKEKKLFFISADIEGVTDVTTWEETEKGNPEYERARLQMTREVAAACEAILEAGCDVVVRDGHDSALNILHDLLPKGVRLMRGWANHPGSMMAGIDEKYAGVLYIGYHSPSGTNGSPLAHSFSHDKINWIRLNGEIMSEFTANSLFAARYGVPSIFLSGDKMMCELAAREVPGIVTVPVKEGRGGSTFNLHPEVACDLIREGVAKAIREDIAARKQPEEFVLEMCLKEHEQARAALYHSGIRMVDAHTVRYTAKDIMEMNVIREYIMRT